MDKKAQTWQQALTRLMEGNQRFVNGLRSIESLNSSMKLKEYAEKGQSPFATILTCSDSRVPTEMLFDQGVGDLFVLRVAGNVVTPSLIASVEFAALNFGTPLCLVMGHTQCGAVKASVASEIEHEPAPTHHLAALVKKITPSVRAAMKSGAGTDASSLVYAASIENVIHSVRSLSAKSPTIRELVDSKRMQVVGSMCDLSTGKVDFFKDAAKDKYALKAAGGLS